MDVAILGELRDGSEIVHSLAGDGTWFGLTVGTSHPLSDSYSERLLGGRIANIVADAHADRRVNHLTLTRRARIGSYIGVPLSSHDARSFILCCLAHQRPATRLAQRDVLFMHGLAATIIDALRVSRRHPR